MVGAGERVKLVARPGAENRQGKETSLHAGWPTLAQGTRPRARIVRAETIRWDYDSGLHGARPEQRKGGSD